MNRITFPVSDTFKGGILILAVIPKSMVLTDFMDPVFRFDIALGHIETVYPIHRHDFIECAYVVDGKGTEIINGRSHPIRYGAFSFLLPYQIHELRAEPGHPLRIFSCGFDPSVIKGSSEIGYGMEELLHDSRSDLPPYHQFEGDEATLLGQIFHQMYIDRYSLNKWRFSFTRAKLLEALILFDRSRSINNQEPISSEISNDQIWDIVQYVHMHFRENITLSSVAHQFHMSAPYLSSLFKRVTGETFIGFLHSTRVQHAASLLITTDMRLTDIALEVGYQTYSTFNRSFYDIKQIPPSEFRNLRHMSGVT